MKDEASLWRRYAEDNLRSARLLLDGGLFNPSIQNAQQAVEKLLKAAVVELSLEFRRTHSIGELVLRLRETGTEVSITDDECDLLDSVYLPSRYPLGSALPEFEPDAALCSRCLAIAERVASDIRGVLA